MDDNDDDEFIDPNDYQGGKEQGVSFNQIILQHIRRCVEAGSKPLTGSYTKEVQTKNGLKEVFVDDQREVYINCIKSFYDLMIPYADKEFEKKEQEFNNRMKEIEDYITNLLTLKKEYAKRNGNEMQERHLEILLVTRHLDPDSFEAKKAIDDKLDAYRMLYQSLITLYVRVVGEGADIND